MKKNIMLLCLFATALFRQATGQNTFPTTGNVGIGTTTPTVPLQVIGQALVSRDNAGECCSGNNYTFAVAENTVGTGRKAKISFHNSGADEGSIELSHEAGFRSIKFYDHQNIGLGIDVRGQGVFARDGAGECCSGVFTLALAENTAATGRKAKISFHNSGQSEGAVELSTEAGFRSLKVYDHQGLNLGLFVTGNVRIGNVDATKSGYKLFVEQGILTEKVKVAIKTTADWSDHVFNKQYPLMPLSEVEAFIKKNGHLPGIPSAGQLKNDGGMDVGKMLALQMEKIEELTLHLIRLEKENRQLKEQLDKNTKQ